MPNWCYNHATFTATTDEAKKLLSDYRDYLSINGNNNFFGFFLPIPQDLKDTIAGFIGGEEGEALKKREEENIAKHGYKNWYEWCVSKWGTKWDIDLDQSCLDGDTITMNEDTAWSPPIEFYRHMEHLGFEVEATYNEEGVGFYGSYSNGCDNEEHYPELKGVASDLLSIFSESGTSYDLVDFDINKIKTGDFVTTQTGENFIYVSHEVYDSANILEEYPELESQLLWDNNPSYEEIASLSGDIYIVKVIWDQTKPGSETAYIFETDMNRICFVD